MEDTNIDKSPKAVSKSLMTAGPTLHYSHKNVQRCWFGAVIVFAMSCLVWSKVVTGYMWSFGVDVSVVPEFWRLDHFIVMGVSIFEYPWQILVLGLLMGMFGIVPLLVSQLMSFRYSIPFVLLVFFVAGLPALALCLLVSCFATACRPLRFRSRIIAITLCTAPQLLYWGFFGGAKGAGPIEWGFSFTPWICAWLCGMCIAGCVLGIGHFTRYKPGLVLIFTSITLVLAGVIFDRCIGFDELDYQLHVARNNPENVAEFGEHSIVEALDAAITDPEIKEHFVDVAIPTEPIALRAELKRMIQTDLEQTVPTELCEDCWPEWFKVAADLKYHDKRKELNEQYDCFMEPARPWWMPGFLYNEFRKSRAVSSRMPIALYYKALLSEYRPDIEHLGSHEVLRFYNDYPHDGAAADLWQTLYRDFGDSVESLEARWRIAGRLAGEGQFAKAIDLLSQAQTMLAVHLGRLEEQPEESDTIFRLFKGPAETAFTAYKLGQLHTKLSELKTLIGPENCTDDPGAPTRLAEFIMLNRHSTDYSVHLGALLEQMSPTDPLRDNILLAQAMFTADEQSRAEKLMDLHGKFQETDGGMQGLYQLSLLRIAQWHNAEADRKKELLAEARTTLDVFVELYAESVYADQVRQNLEGLPDVGP